jgi:hypothetical protein
MTFLLVAFTFFTVIYLMNLFIGLLNIAIADYNKEEEFLLQKAQVILVTMFGDDIKFSLITLYF